MRPGAYQRPVPPVPKAWPESAGQPGAPEAPEATSLKWQEFFTDPRLRSVIELALVNNRDLRMAALNIEKVQAMYQIQRAQQYPTLGATLSGEGYRVPANMSSNDTPYTVSQYTASPASVSWELDLFGRVRSLKTAALERYLATEQARSAAQIALIGAVAGSYLALAADRDHLRLAQETLAVQQASYELILRTREAGLASDLDVRQAQSQVEAARVDIARYSGLVSLDENALNLLVGASVPASLLPSELNSDTALKDISAGVPSDVLLRRPDILTAEHELQAAYANIGAARAAFFPRISLTGGVGFVSSELQNLFTYNTRTWTFCPPGDLAHFRLRGAESQLQSRPGGSGSGDRRIREGNSVGFPGGERRPSPSDETGGTTGGAASPANRLGGDLPAFGGPLYKAGIDSYLSVLVAQRSLYGARQVMINLRMARLGNLVTLYKALGGGL
jgi:multidrug efflux system outer membrane protein